MHLRTSAIVVIVLMLLTVGCGDDSVTRIDVESAGTTVELAADEAFELSLEANPTTGYQWVVLDPGVVELISESHEPQSEALGAGGITTFIFSPTGEGTADLTLGYLRPWEEGIEPIDTFTVTISVTG